MSAGYLISPLRKLLLFRSKVEDRLIECSERQLINFVKIVGKQVSATGVLMAGLAVIAALRKLK